MKKCKKCKNCKHWDIADGYGGYGICDYIELNVDTFARPSLDGAFVESDSPESFGAILVTGPNFFCAKFEKR